MDHALEIEALDPSGGRTPGSDSTTDLRRPPARPRALEPGDLVVERPGRGSDRLNHRRGPGGDQQGFAEALGEGEPHRDREALAGRAGEASQRRRGLDGLGERGGRSPEGGPLDLRREQLDPLDRRLESAEGPR